jgi:hypothetical protein
MLPTFLQVDLRRLWRLWVVFSVEYDSHSRVWVWVVYKKVPDNKDYKKKIAPY